MSQFSRTGITNLLRHSESGTYYFRVKLNGVQVRRSLETKDKKVARYILRDEIEKERARSRGLVSMKESRSREMGQWGWANGEWLAMQRMRPELQEATVTYYALISGYLEQAFPADKLLSEISEKAAARWWRGVAMDRPSRVANNMLAAVRGLGVVCRARGLSLEDPFRGCKRVKVGASELVVPSAEEMASILASIRGIAKAHSAESGDLVEFLAFTGLRISEAGGVKWSDVGRDFLTVRGKVNDQGRARTKSGKSRLVPIAPRVRELLAQRRGPGRAQGSVFTTKTPRESLKNACKRVGVPHMRVHDLRHYFATQCIEAGVDIPTVAKWLGHQDGGVLAMKTYGHIRDDHSLKMVELIG